jgi:hypothetical protein
MILIGNATIVDRSNEAFDFFWATDGAKCTRIFYEWAIGSVRLAQKKGQP